MVAPPGLFLTSVYASRDASDSPDPAIQGSASSLAYRATSTAQF
jgi:hypothetical protein